jgi:hypothetical protein
MRIVERYPVIFDRQIDGILQWMLIDKMFSGLNHWNPRVFQLLWFPKAQSI